MEAGALWLPSLWRIVRCRCLSVSSIASVRFTFLELMSPFSFLCFHSCFFFPSFLTLQAFYSVHFRAVLELIAGSI